MPGGHDRYRGPQRAPVAFRILALLLYLNVIVVCTSSPKYFSLLEHGISSLLILTLVVVRAPIDLFVASRSSDFGIVGVGVD